MIYHNRTEVSSKVKPTIRIKRLKRDDPIKVLKGASVIQRNLKAEREKGKRPIKR
jgi:hypothetical protein